MEPAFPLSTAQVLGADSEQIKRSYTVTARCEFIHNFLLQIRSISQLKYTTIVFCVERNTGQEVGTLYDYLARQQLGLLHLYKDHDDEIGLWTDLSKKRLYLHATRTFLSYASLALCEDWVSRNTEQTQRELYEQLVRAREIVITAKHPTSIDKWTWSGKMTADGKRSDRYNDDLAMSLMQCFYLVDNILMGMSPIPSPIAGLGQRPPDAPATRAAKRARIAAI